MVTFVFPTEQNLLTMRNINKCYKLNKSLDDIYCVNHKSYLLGLRPPMLQWKLHQKEL